MYYKNNVKKLMKEYNYSLNELKNNCELSLNTLRELKNNPFHNFNMESAYNLAQAFNCSIKDIIDDDVTTIYFDQIAEENKNDPFFINHQVFSPENVHYLRKLFLEVGVPCNIKPYGLYKKAIVKAQEELSSIFVDFNLLLKNEGTPTLFVRDFFVVVNKVILNETIIKDAFIKAFEIYARKLKISQIQFSVLNDFQMREYKAYESLSDLPSDYSFTVGTESSIFIENNFEGSTTSFFLVDTTLWRKTLS
ncbi:hypothetical protein BMWSH_2327 [Priestia megaterium WSH-002]|uniref:HTH cro/C1-type domain-containing protein n=1 Tax=Priestia megaterium (strain WSH-002) TaxID=1006007 RepID=A0A8D3WYI2_PRIMW|nr:helix-turn-helix transcriptional regulator [Priestia megaterium]AEN89209.1 hypothetical protein BMWSH_2327 [Priestia megaterium WSH-002]